MLPEQLLDFKMLAPGGQDNVGPKGAVGERQRWEIEGRKVVLELGGCCWLEERLHVWMAEQDVHHLVGAFAGDRDV